jgi:uncharacterized membrane protein YciS (DUF1049 family)
VSVSLFKLFFGKKSLKGLLLPLFGLLLSIALIPLIFQINHDVKQVLKGGEEDYQYLQISKEVGISTALGLGTINFSSSEINKLKAQSYIEDVAQVTSNNFRVYVKAPQNRGGFDGYMHSVPDDFLDEKPHSFSWEVGQEEIPVIISNQFFTLLNTGILPAQGQPPIPKIAIKQLSLPVYLGRGEKRIEMRVRVAGFSDRITTVIVPRTFIDWANNNFHPKKKSESTMAILKVKDSGDKDLEKYLARNDYEVNKEQLVAQKGMWIAQVILVILFTLGLIISFLSINSMILFVRLVVMESMKKIEMLLLLGYKSSDISGAIIKFFSGLVLFTASLSGVLDGVVIHFLHSVIKKYSSIELELSGSFVGFFPVVVLVIVVFVTLSVRGVIKKFSVVR